MFSFDVQDDSKLVAKHHKPSIIGRNGKYHNILCLSTQILDVFFVSLGTIASPKSNRKQCLKNLGGVVKQRVLWYFPLRPTCCISRVQAHDIVDPADPRDTLPVKNLDKRHFPPPSPRELVA